MLGAGRDDLIAGRPVRAFSLKTAHFGLRIKKGNKRVFARTFGHAAPTRITRHIQHGCEGQGNGVLRGFARGKRRGPLPQIGLKSRGFTQRIGNNGTVAVQHIEAKQKRNCGGRLLKCDFLDGGDVFPSVNIEDAADLSLPDAGQDIRQTVLKRGLHRGQHIELSDLFPQAQAGQQSFGGQ